ncbi:MAG: preprotein translocase subunit SecE [Oscillospiraceae bacterium]|nr:preprotein translocase subunit SecE [Oscillospiraceae bacterium]
MADEKIPTEDTTGVVTSVSEKKADKKSVKKSDAQGNKFSAFWKKLGKRISGFFRDYKSEMKKVVWYPKKDVIKSTGVVLVAIVGVGLVVGLLDLGLTELILLLGKIS